MTIAPFQRRSLADQAADAVLNLILTGELNEGDSLPSSAELAKRFDVSVVVVREALASLAGRGILSRRQGREPVVAMPGADILSSILRVRAHHEGISVDDFQECRAGLEVKAAALAAERAEATIARAALEPCIEGMRNAKSTEAFKDNDLAFHFALASLSGNRATSLILETLTDLVRETIDVTHQRVWEREGKPGIDHALGFHERIAAAVIKGDARKAAQAMTEHFAYSATVWPSGS